MFSIRHGSRDMALTVHGDDFAVTGAAKEIKWLEHRFKAKFEVKCEVLGPQHESVCSTGCCGGQVPASSTDQ